MPAQIVSLAPVRGRTAAPEPVALGLPQDLPGRLHFWRGASGKRYVHHVYSLIECPPLPRALYLLVQRGKDGRRRVLHISRGESEAPTLNLARVRQRGAQLGANEVHVNFIADDETQSQLVMCDLRAGQFGELSAEPSSARADA
jgi:hypothetical protein